MQAELIQPFLTSSIQVIETIIQVRPSVGRLHLTEIASLSDCVWLKIHIWGQFEKEILFAFPDRMAMNIVSTMLGGYVVTELDDMCRSAVAELGNMISGNASTMLSHKGIAVDITPPLLMEDVSEARGKTAVSIPVEVERIGAFKIHILV